MHPVSIQRIFPKLIAGTAASLHLSIADFRDVLKRAAAEQIDNDQRLQTDLMEWIETHGHALDSPIAEDQRPAAEPIAAMHSNEPTADRELAPFVKQPATGASIPKGKMVLFEQSKDIDSPAKDQIVQGVPVENAGLVLLWPFLSHFFKQLNLVGDNGLVDQTAAFRAVLLLQYLATGQSQTAEPYLVLNKVLCGLDPETPVPRRIRLRSTEKKECRQMLKAVIQRWAALKNTSVQGLQSSFLQRFGLLSATEHNWLLRVERKAFDLLLDRLPWGIGTLKLSWMARFLVVEW